MLDRQSPGPKGCPHSQCTGSPCAYFVDSVCKLSFKPRARRRARQSGRLLLLTGSALVMAGLLVAGYPFLQMELVKRSQEQLKQDFPYVYSPAVPPEIEAEPSEPGEVILTAWRPMRLVIPAIAVDLVVLNGDVFDQKLLDKGPVHYPMSSLPGTRPGNVAIAAHRAGKWNFFRRLDELAAGDAILLDTGSHRFIYRVQWTRIIQPDDWSVIDPTEYSALTLTTCEPLNRPATHRLVVRAVLESVSASFNTTENGP